MRFWQDDHVTSRYLSSMFLGHSSATDILQKITTCLTDNLVQKITTCLTDNSVQKITTCLTDNSVSVSKVVQLSMDGPNVNLKLHALMDEELCSETEGAPGMLSFGSCGLHTVHNAFKFKAGAKASEWGIEDIISSLYWLFFTGSPARRQDFTTITSSEMVLLKYCKHRLLENVPVVQFNSK